MKKKGFTLVEILVVILIIGILIVIAIPSYNKLFKDIKRDNYEAKVTEIETAASKYAVLMKDEIKESGTGCVSTNVEELIEKGYLLSEDDNKNVIYDPTNNEELSGTIKMCYCITTYDIESYYSITFEDKKMYHKGDKVYHENRIYRCINDYPGVGGITATYEKNGKTYNYFEEVPMCEQEKDDHGEVVSFDANGGTVSPSIKAVTYGQSYGELPTPKRLGYTFAGWLDDELNEITETTKVILRSDHTLRAEWIPNEYNITYDLKSGTKGEYAPNKGVYDEEIIISNPTKEVVVKVDLNGSGAESTSEITKELEFLGWAAEGINSSTAYEGNQKWTNGNELSKEITYKNLSPVNNGTIELTAHYETTEVELPSIEKEGYECYYTTEASGGEKISSSGNLELDGSESVSQSVYVQCDNLTYTVTFNANGGTVSPTSKEITYDEAYGELPTPTRLGYLFKAWKLDGKEVTTNTKVSYAKNHTLTAKWEAIKYNIEYDLDGGTKGNIQPVSGFYDKTIKISNPKKIITISYEDLNITYQTELEFVGWVGSNVNEATAYYGNTKWTDETSPTSSSGYDTIENAGVFTKEYYTNFKNLQSEQGKTVKLTAKFKDAVIKLPPEEESEEEGYTCKFEKDGVVYELGSDYTVKASSDQTLDIERVCEKNSYTVTFNANGGTVNPTSKTIEFDSAYGELPTPAKDAYAFGGWYLSDGTQVTSSTIVSIAENHTLYAKWNERNDIEYEIRYYQANLSGDYSETPTSVETRTGSTNEEITITPKDFTGFITPASEKIKLTKDGLYVDLYYDRRTVTITYYRNRTTSDTETSTETYVYGGTNSFNDRKFTKTGYTLTGWQETRGGATTYLTTSTVPNNWIHEKYPKTNLYAEWTANTYYVAYNCNGGSGSMSTDKHTYDTEKALTKNTCTKTGYLFSGWTFNNTTYSDKQVVVNLTTKPNATVTMTAIWTPITYYVKYDKGTANGTETMANTTCTYDRNCTLRANTYTKTGYSFKGWTFNGTTYSNSGTVLNLTASHGTTVTLTAAWTPNNYKVTFNGNGGTPSVASKTVTYDSTYGELATATRPGYHYTDSTKIWYTTVSGGTSIVSSTKVTTPNDHTLYVHWTANTYAIVYNANGGYLPSGKTMANSSCTYDKDCKLTTNVFERVGYTFKGWSTSTSGSAMYSNSENVENLTTTQNGTVTLYAIWQANTYTLTYNGNGGTPSATSKTVTYDSAYGQLATATRPGYHHTDSTKIWYTAASGGTAILSTTKVTTAANHTIYNHWTPNTYTIAFNGNGATSGSTASKSSTYDTACTLTANGFARTGYDFAGWSTTTTGIVAHADKANVSNLTTTQNGTVTLYAKWTPKNYKVTINAGTNGTASATSINVPYAGTNTFTITPNEGYYLSDITCTNSYTATGFTTTTSSTGTQMVTVKNPSSTNTSTCTATYTKVPYAAVATCSQGSVSGTTCHFTNDGSMCGYNTKWSDCATGSNTCQPGTITTTGYGQCAACGADYDRCKTTGCEVTGNQQIETNVSSTRCKYFTDQNVSGECKTSYYCTNPAEGMYNVFQTTRKETCESYYYAYCNNCPVETPSDCATGSNTCVGGNVTDYSSPKSCDKSEYFSYECPYGGKRNTTDNMCYY